MPMTWAQKRAGIAQALQGGNPPSVGAGSMVNPMISAMSPQAPGLMGSAPTQGQMMAQANASLQGAPGFNYVPPQVGPAPVPAVAGVAGPNGTMMTPEVAQAMQFGGRFGPYNPAYQRNGANRDRGGYTTSGRDSRGSSSSYGGAQRGGGLY